MLQTVQCHPAKLNAYNKILSNHLFAVGALKFTLVGPDNHLQMSVDSYSENGVSRGYLPVVYYMNLKPGFHTNEDWDTTCKALGYDHMMAITAHLVQDVSVLPLLSSVRLRCIFSAISTAALTKSQQSLTT